VQPRLKLAGDGHAAASRTYNGLHPRIGGDYVITTQARGGRLRSDIAGGGDFSRKHQFPPWMAAGRLTLSQF
jgi:hypothetical protein